MTERTRRAADGPLALLLAQGVSHAEAAKRVHVAPSTVTRRLREPAFRALVDDYRRQVWEEALGACTSACTTAVATLVALLGADTPPAVRLGAAKTILEAVQHGVAQAGLEERLSALEAEVGRHAGLPRAA
jgi:hypothetical protein